MGDSKALYSEASKIFVERANAKNELLEFEYQKSKNREEKHNQEWLKHPANLNDVVHAFAPEHESEQKNGKFIFKGSDGRYNIIADMAAGYLRIYDRRKKQYVQLNGEPGSDRKTHFKIKKREEM